MDFIYNFISELPTKLWTARTSLTTIFRLIQYLETSWTCTGEVVVAVYDKDTSWYDACINTTQLNSTHSLMRKDLTGHTGPNGHLHMPIIKLKK